MPCCIYVSGSSLTGGKWHQRHKAAPPDCTSHMPLVATTERRLGTRVYFALRAHELANGLGVFIIHHIAISCTEKTLLRCSSHSTFIRCSRVYLLSLSLVIGLLTFYDS